MIGVGYARWRSTWGRRNELCCNKIDRLCALPCGFTWLNRDWWSISPTGSPLTQHSAQLQTQRTGSLPLRDLFLSCQSFLLMDSGLVAHHTPNRMVVLSVSQSVCIYWSDHLSTLWSNYFASTGQIDVKFGVKSWHDMWSPEDDSQWLECILTHQLNQFPYTCSAGPT